MVDIASHLAYHLSVSTPSPPKRKDSAKEKFVTRPLHHDDGDLSLDDQSSHSHYARSIETPMLLAVASSDLVSY